MIRRHSEVTLGVEAITSAVFYLPLTFWATNAWQLSPAKPLLYGTLLSVLGVGVYLLGRRFVKLELPLALTVATILMVLMSWTRLSTIHPLFPFVPVVAVGTIIAHLSLNIRRGLAIGFILFFGVGSIGQVVFSHIAQISQVPTIEFAPREAANGGVAVEDVLVVIVDSYPSLTVASDWFGHDVSSLTSSLSELGYQVPEVAWSQHTNTSFAVPALMELQPVIDTNILDPWGNTKNLRKIIGGESLVAQTLRSAGYEYTHIESGWHHGACIDVDICVGSSWLDETAWHLLEPSIAGEMLVKSQRSWMVPATLRTYRELLQLSSIFGDGDRDYVFAHLLLPHEPYVMDERCSPVETSRDDRKELVAIGEQLSCVDQLLAELAIIAADDTAVLITADHGIKTGGQMGVAPEKWTDRDIAEAFGVFLAYRMPDACSSPSANVNTLVMRAIMECAVDFDSPHNEGELLIGQQPYRWVSRSEVEVIEQRLTEGELRYVQTN